MVHNIYVEPKIGQAGTQENQNSLNRGTKANPPHNKSSSGKLTFKAYLESNRHDIFFVMKYININKNHHYVRVIKIVFYQCNLSRKNVCTFRNRVPKNVVTEIT